MSSRPALCKILIGSLLVGLICLYLFISLHNLGTVPPVYEDEPWIASVAWNLSTRGILGSDLFTGFYGMEQHIYVFMPLNQFLSAPILQVGGLGLFQIRMVTVIFGTVVLLLTFALGVRLFGAPVGLLSVIFLLFARTMSSSTYNITGIPLLDIVRIHRYDPGVAVFGLAGFHAYLFAAKQHKQTWYFIAGLMVGLAGLTHLYGIFWLVPIGLLSLFERAAPKSLVAIMSGFLAPWALYGLYTVGDLPNWLGQTQVLRERFDLFNPAWYWRNLYSEYKRYSLGLLPFSRASFLRVGSWIMVLLVPSSIAGLGWRAFSQRDRRALSLFVPAVILPAMFALFLNIKFRNYLFMLIPLLALAAAWGVTSFWRAVGRHAILRVVLVLSIAAVITEGVSRMAVLEDAACRHVSYESYISGVREHLPEDGRVLGLHRYWIGLHDREYRSWLLPLYQVRDIHHPKSVEAALDQIDPQVILIDPAMRQYLSNPQLGDNTPTQIRVWMDLNGYQLISSFEDATYGKMEIFRRMP